MNSLKDRSISERILALESRVSIEKYTYNDICIWPYLRIAMHLSFKGTNDSQNSTSTYKKVLFLFAGIIEFFKWKLGLWPKANHLFLSSSHYKTKKDGISYDRIVDPFLNWLKSRNKKYTILEFNNRFDYKERLSHNKEVIRIQPLLYLVSFLWRIKFLFSQKVIKEKTKGDYDHLNQLLEQYSIPLEIKKNYQWRVFLLERQTVFFEQILGYLGVSHVGVVCFYDFKSFSLIRACNRLNLPSIDLQHGLQGPQHMAYSNWPKDLAKGSEFFPSHFWVWDEFSYNTIGKWKNHSKILLGCNKWFWDKVILDSPEMILFSIQPIENPIPNFLFEVIRKYSGDKKWYFRLHPQQLGQMDKFKDLIKAEGLENKINIEQASLVPLTELLPKTLVHLTFYSSVTIESSYYNIPTIFLDERGLMYYGDQLIENFIFSPIGSTEILNCINSIEGKVFDQSELINTSNILNRFKIIDRFFEQK